MCSGSLGSYVFTLTSMGILNSESERCVVNYTVLVTVL